MGEAHARGLAGRELVGADLGEVGQYVRASSSNPELPLAEVSCS
jgi:hypothetical protein